MNSRSTSDLLARLRGIVGSGNLLRKPDQTLPFRTGYRHGSGDAVAVALPQSLVALWRVLKACVESRAIVIMQAANTGLTGGSTPAGEYDRDIVIISTRRLGGIHLIDDGRQAVCLPGATLHELEARLKPLGREPHSVIGSSCIGASVIGGICNNSGGALVRRGPAFTEMALFARLDERHQLELVNHLGISLGTDPEEILERLERGAFAPTDVEQHPSRRGSDRDYARRIREVDSAEPCRFNADPRGLHEASGSAGRVVVFAVRLDTFPEEAGTRLFYVGTNDPADLSRLRRAMLTSCDLPVAAEYIHRDAFTLAEAYGKDLFYAVRGLGTRSLPTLFAWKAGLDRLGRRVGLAAPLGDRLLQGASSLLPRHLPPWMREWNRRYEHHLLLKMSGEGVEQARSCLQAIFPSAVGDFRSCDDADSAKAFLHRFAVAGAAVRYRAVHGGTVEDIIALDVALPANATDWVDSIPGEIRGSISHAIYYGHFFCHVFHRDYIVRKGADARRVADILHRRLDEIGARYPAEHNVGHMYSADPTLTDFYRQLDPTNSLNPGIGQTSRKIGWQ